MIPVVVNADDFGMTEGVCRGIVRAIQTGGVTATTAMICVPGAEQRLCRWAPEIRGHIGAHLQLTSGRPVLPARCVPSLVGADGCFPSTRKQVRSPKTEEIFLEWRAQIELLSSLGIKPTHIDTHHHIHRLPAALPAFCEIAKHFGLPARSLDDGMRSKLRHARVSSVDKTLTGWYGGDLTAARLVQLLKTARAEFPACRSFEVMCHPGIADSELAGLSRYTDDRERELAALCDSGLRQALAAAGFSLVTISQIAGRPEKHGREEATRISKGVDA